MTPAPRVEWVERAADLHRDGLTLEAIGKRVGVSTARVQAALRSRGVPRRAPRERWGEPSIAIEALVLRRRTSMTWPEIARVLGIAEPPPFVSRRARNLAVAWARRRGILVERMTTEGA